MNSGVPSGAVGVRGGGLGTLRPGADRVLVAVEEDLAVRVPPLELSDLGEDLFESGAFVIRIDPKMHRLLGFFGRSPRLPHQTHGAGRLRAPPLKGLGGGPGAEPLRAEPRIARARP